MEQTGRLTEREILTRPRTRPENVKDRIVRERGYKTIRPKSEDVVDFEYKPVSCKSSHQDTGLTAETAYTYTVSAYDAAGNVSVQSGV